MAGAPTDLVDKYQQGIRIAVKIHSLDFLEMTAFFAFVPRACCGFLNRRQSR